VNCSTVNLKLAGVNLTRFYWDIPNLKIDSLQIGLIKNETVFLNATLAGSKNYFDAFNLEFDKE
jgi:hypothetical protein